MTEMEWLACEDPEALLLFLSEKDKWVGGRPPLGVREAQGQNTV